MNTSISSEASVRPSQALLSGQQSQNSPRTVIRGENSLPPSESTGQYIVIDWLAYSIPVPPKAYLKPSDRSAMLANVYGLHDPERVPVAVLEHLSAVLGLVSYSFAVYQGKGWQGYAESMALHRQGYGHCGVIAWGGNEDTIHVELTGKGCGGLDLRRVYSMLKAAGGKTTRVDIAMDDFSGKYSAQWAKDRHAAGAFSWVHGRPPSVRGIEVDGALQTVYIGTRAGGKMLRAYDKAVEQDYQGGPWWRLELEWRASARRSIPLEVLLDPAAYFAGSYPALSVFASVAVVVKTLAREASASVEKAIKHCRIQYGKLLGWLREQGLSSDEVMARVVRDGTPGKIGRTLLCGVAV